MGKPEPRTLNEQVGASLNAKSLEMRGRSPNVETPLLKVAALGASGLHVAHGADYRREPIATVINAPGHVANPQDVLAAELGSLLLHLREGGQHELIAKTIRVFSDWMGYRTRVSRFPDSAVLRPKLAERALHEFLSDHCPRCGGTGRLEQTASGNLVRGTGRMARNAIFRNCPNVGGCGGTGRTVPSHTARRLALGLTHERYEQEGWGAIVAAAITWLSGMQGRMRRPLTVQLQRSTKRD